MVHKKMQVWVASFVTQVSLKNRSSNKDYYYYFIPRLKFHTAQYSLMELASIYRIFSTLNAKHHIFFFWTSLLADWLVDVRRFPLQTYHMNILLFSLSPNLLSSGFTPPSSNRKYA